MCETTAEIHFFLKKNLRKQHYGKPPPSVMVHAFSLNKLIYYIVFLNFDGAPMVSQLFLEFTIYLRQQLGHKDVGP